MASSAPFTNSTPSQNTGITPGTTTHAEREDDMGSLTQVDLDVSSPAPRPRGSDMDEELLPTQPDLDALAKQRRKRWIWLAAWSGVVSIAVILILVYALRSKKEVRDNHSSPTVSPVPSGSPSSNPIPSSDPSPSPNPTAPVYIESPLFYAFNEGESINVYLRSNEDGVPRVPNLPPSGRITGFSITSGSPLQFNASLQLSSDTALVLSSPSIGPVGLYRLGIRVDGDSNTDTFTLTIQVVPSLAGFAWHISDVHYNPRFRDRSTGGQLCTIESSNAPYLPWGKEGCDPPWLVIKSMIRAAGDVKGSAGFIALTGDYAMHDNSNSIPMVTPVLAEFRSTFKNANFGVALGNNDVYPDYYLQLTSPSPVLDALSGAYTSNLLTAEQQSTFQKGGYYKTTIPGANGDHIGLVWNTVLYSRKHFPTTNEDDPLGQFAWMRTELTTARTLGVKVLLLSHIPFGIVVYDELNLWQTKYREEYFKLVRDFTDTIAYSWCGHLHEDEYRLLLNTNGTGVDLVSLQAPSISPVYSDYPSIRLVVYDKASLQMLDYTQIFADYKGANSNKRPVLRWQMEYNAKDEYGLSFTSKEDWLDLRNRMRNNATLLNEYIRHRKADHTTGFISPQCRAKSLCAIDQVDSTRYQSCKTQYVQTQDCSAGCQDPCPGY